VDHPQLSGFRLVLKGLFDRCAAGAALAVRSHFFEFEEIASAQFRMAHELEHGDVFAVPSWCELSLHAALRLGKHNGSSRLAFGGRAILERLDCPGCGFTRKVFHLNGRIRLADRCCDRCKRPLLATGFHMREFVTSGALSTRDAARSLASIGLRAGDVFSVSNGRREQYYELGEPGGKS
jgi:hypothetical protein